MDRFNIDDEKYRCICGLVHVRTCTLVLAILGVIGSIGEIANPDRTYAGVPGIFIFALAIYAHFGKVAWAYIPMFIMEAINAVISGVGCAGSLLLYAVSHTHWFQQAFDKDIEKDWHVSIGVFQLYLAIAAIVFAISAALSTYFTRVVYNAYDWQKKQEVLSPYDDRNLLVA
ncbi:hypothetical protein AAVH_16430 [Aphelenchoides avenae]|nr:hypothetical protein AAVH_16430 [Aphelenchus avenae]